MNDNVKKLILAQLRDIRTKLDAIDGRFDGFNDRIDDLAGKVLANTTVVMALAQYIGAMNERVEHIETHLGIAQ